MDKKTISLGLIVLSVIAVLLAGLDYASDLALFNLGADSWLLVAANLGIYAVFSKLS